MPLSEVEVVDQPWERNEKVMLIVFIVSLSIAIILGIVAEIVSSEKFKAIFKFPRLLELGLGFIISPIFLSICV